MDKIQVIYSRLIRVVLLATLIVSSAGCKIPISEKFETLSIFANPTCVPPCWQNIEPGKSSEQDAISALKKVPDIDLNSIITKGEHWDIFDDIVYFSIHDESIVGRVYILDGKVAMIDFSRMEFRDNLDMTFGDAIDEFGEPQYIINMPIRIEIAWNILLAIQPKKGIIITCDVGYIDWRSKTSLKQDSKIQYVTFFDPALYEKLLDARYISGGGLDRTDTENSMIPWNGYGKIYTLYPPAKISPTK